ncbi:MAG: hypothetical protein RIB86_07760 [Imperialibacter sp.]
MKITNIPRAIKYFFSLFKEVNRLEKHYLAKRWLVCKAECDKAIAAGLGGFFAHYYLGLTNSELGHVDESTRNLKYALDNFSDRGIKAFRNFAKYKIAMNYIQQEQYDLAFEQIDRNMSEDPKYLNNYELKASIYLGLDDMDKAIETVLQALQKAPKNERLKKYRDYLSYSYSVALSDKRNGG